MAHFINDLYAMLLTEGFQTLLVCLKSLLTLLIKIDVSGHLLHHQLHAVGVRVRSEVIVQVDGHTL